MKNYYEILEVNENASTEVIERVYKVLAKKYHPDLNPNNKKEAEEKFKEVSEAYEVLSNDLKRKDYDSKLKAFKQKEILKSVTTNYANTNYSSNSSNGSTSTNDQRTGRINSEDLIRAMKQYNSIKEQQEYQMKKAYNDAYVDAMRKMGFRVKYKKTFKERLVFIKNLFLTFVVVAIIGFILFQIPPIREPLVRDYNNTKFLKPFIERIINK